MTDAAMENPTIVVITDRNDLDGQLFGVLSLSQDLLREQSVQGETRQDLQATVLRAASLLGTFAARRNQFCPPSRWAEWASTALCLMLQGKPALRQAPVTSSREKS